MARTLLFQTESFGSEPAIPDADEISEWVGLQRGSFADITSYLLEAGILPQIDAGLDLPCAGGRFYRDRWVESLADVADGAITGEMGHYPELLEKDVARVRNLAGLCRFSVPAPHLLELEDRYFGDREEAVAALCRQYRFMLRTMRDRGIAGHVIIGEKAVPEEMEILAGKKVFFFYPEMDKEILEFLLEHQDSVALRPDQLDLLTSFFDEFNVSRVILIDPDDSALRQLLEFRDPDHIRTGGYCTEGCEHYWQGLVKSSKFRL